MKTALIALWLIALPSAASAGVFTLSDGSQRYVIDPPRYFLGNPFTGEIDLQLMPRADASRICSEAIGEYEEAACAWPISRDLCRIMIADDLPDDLGNAVLQHEYAHCAGWPADHPLD